VSGTLSQTCVASGSPCGLSWCPCAGNCI
jgi:hypothetical protein